jgi:hypothetical protein
LITFAENKITMRNFLLIIFSIFLFTTVNAQMNCSNFCVTNISIDTANNTVNILKVTILNGDTNAVNYPIVQVVNSLGDTVANKSGQFYLFQQGPNTSVTHDVPTTLDSLPTNFTGVVYLTDPMSHTTCMFNYPMICSVGINEHSVSNSIRVFPNPATDNITIAIDGLNNKTANITIYDVLGNTVRSYNTSNDQLTINREGIESGMYFITVITDNNRYSNKLIIK